MVSSAVTYACKLRAVAALTNARPAESAVTWVALVGGWVVMAFSTVSVHRWRRLLTAGGNGSTCSNRAIECCSRLVGASIYARLAIALLAEFFSAGPRAHPGTVMACDFAAGTTDNIPALFIAYIAGPASSLSRLIRAI